MATTEKALSAEIPKPAKKEPKRSKANGAPAEAAVIGSDDGRTIIRNQVVAKIAGLAAREVPGVHKLVPYGASQQVSSLAKTVTGTQMRDLGIHVDVGDEEAAIDVRIITDYGASIPEVADGIRRNVFERVQEMTGLQVVEINIDVVDLFFGEDEDEDTGELLLQPSRVS